MRVRALLFSSSVAVSLAGCATTATAPGRSPSHAADDSAASAANDDGSLPAYFSVEIGVDGSLVADGTPVADLDALATLASSVLASGRVEGAAVLMSRGASEARRHEIVRVLVDAGFVHVRLGPIASQGTSDDSKPQAEEGEVASAPREDSERIDAAPTDPASGGVSVETIGLHIGGSSNDPEERASWLAVLEQSFADLQSCFPKAAPTRRTRSFGVDLLIPSSGQEPKVRDVRTSLQGEEFRQCAVAAFEKLEFPPPPRGPTVVSYSVRFDPAAGT